MDAKKFIVNNGCKGEGIEKVHNGLEDLLIVLLKTCIASRVH